MDKASLILELSESLSSELEKVDWEFAGIVCNPLVYAWENYAEYVRMSVSNSSIILFLGMNPGPYGMMQTGVPFGDINAVKNYLKISGTVLEPECNPPHKRVEGMKISRGEISGQKFWKMASTYGSPEEFFAVASVFSFCPLAFIDGRRNITPDELPVSDRKTIDRICGSSLSALLDILSPSRCIALGHYAEKRLLSSGVDAPVYFPHPSPRNPKSMEFWDSGKALESFREVVNEARG